MATRSPDQPACARVPGCPTRPTHHASDPAARVDDAQSSWTYPRWECAPATSNRKNSQGAVTRVMLTPRPPPPPCWSALGDAPTRTHLWHFHPRRRARHGPSSTTPISVPHPFMPACERSASHGERSASRGEGSASRGERRVCRGERGGSCGPVVPRRRCLHRPRDDDRTDAPSSRRPSPAVIQPAPLAPAVHALPRCTSRQQSGTRS